MTDFLKLVTALLAIYFGMLGIRGGSNVDAEGRYTSAGKRTLGIFLALSVLGIVAMLGESVDESRKANLANRRYGEATARDSVNLLRSELLLDRTEMFFHNLRRVDSLAELQLATRSELLAQQQALLSSQSALLQNTVRARFPHNDSITGVVSVVIAPSFEPANRLLDSIWRTAIAYLPTLIRDSAEVGRRSEFVVAFKGEACIPPAPASCRVSVPSHVTYTIKPDTTIPWEQRVRPQEFFIESIDLMTHWDPLTTQFLYAAELEFFCCGYPRSSSEIPMLSVPVGGANSVEIRGTWDDPALHIMMSAMGLGRSPNLSVADLVGARALLRVPDYIPLTHSRTSIFLPIAQHRNLVLGAERLRRVEHDLSCICLSTDVVASDLELYPGELAGAPQRPMVLPLAPLRQEP